MLVWKLENLDLGRGEGGMNGGWHGDEFVIRQVKITRERVCHDVHLPREVLGAVAGVSRHGVASVPARDFLVDGTLFLLEVEAFL